MDPNTVFHFASLAFSQKTQPIQEDEPEQLEWPLRLAAAFLRGLWNLPTALANHGKPARSQSTPTLERAVN
jgi:hypothetical protein